MKKYIEFTLFPRKEVSRNKRGSDLPEDVYLSLRDRWPEFSHRSSFKVSLLHDSDELDEILSFLEGKGFSANRQRYPAVKRCEQGRFQLKGKRIFDDGELDRAHFLHAVPADQIADEGGHLDDGTLFVKPRSIKKRIALGRIFGSSTSVCNEALRAQLQDEGFKSLVFRDIHNAGSFIYQLWSDLKLPEMRNLFFDEGDPDYGRMINDLFSPQLPDFSPQDIEALPDFDFAISQERIGGGAERSRDPLLIISQRVRKFFDSQGLKVHYTPIKGTKHRTRRGTESLTS
jgi:hypothetical protein